MKRKYWINVQNEDASFSVESNTALKPFDCILYNNATLFLSEKMDNNSFKAYRVDNVVAVHSFS